MFLGFTPIETWGRSDYKPNTVAPGFFNMELSYHCNYLVTVDCSAEFL